MYPLARLSGNGESGEAKKEVMPATNQLDVSLKSFSNHPKWGYAYPLVMANSSPWFFDGPNPEGMPKKQHITSSNGGWFTIGFTKRKVYLGLLSVLHPLPGHRKVEPLCHQWHVVRGRVGRWENQELLSS